MPPTLKELNYQDKLRNNAAGHKDQSSDNKIMSAFGKKFSNAF